MSRIAECMLVVALLVAVGCEDATQPTPSPSDVFVTTDKTHYVPQEPILVTVSNQGESSIWLWLYDCLPSFEKRLMGGWEPELIEVCPAGWSYYQLDPGQSLERTWETLPRGQYRILVYSYDEPGCAAEELCEMKPPDVHQSRPFDVD